MTSVMRTSILTGKTHTREIDVPSEALEAWMDGPRQARPHVEDAFPELDADDREFLLNGITPEEWAETFGNEAFGEEDAD